jgi:hypothetical protein
MDSDETDRAKNEATFWSEAGDGLGCMFVLFGFAAVIVAIGYLLHGSF